jgi:hypothetical protein
MLIDDADIADVIVADAAGGGEASLSTRLGMQMQFRSFDGIHLLNS